MRKKILIAAIAVVAVVAVVAGVDSRLHHRHSAAHAA